jgi:hypothetical protein
MLAEPRLNPKALPGLLGHADIRTTPNLYVQITDNLAIKRRSPWRRSSSVGRTMGRKRLNLPKKPMEQVFVEPDLLLRM